MAANASTPALNRYAARINVVNLIALALVALVVVWLVVNFFKSPSQFFEVTLIGITNGCIYALVALGYTLVYGILELINFAHGDVFMLGGMFSDHVRVLVRDPGGPGRALAARRPDPHPVCASLRNRQRDDRARRLPAAQTRAATRAADHRDRGQLHPRDGRR